MTGHHAGAAPLSNLNLLEKSPDPLQPCFTGGAAGVPAGGAAMGLAPAGGAAAAVQDARGRAAAAQHGARDADADGVARAAPRHRCHRARAVMAACVLSEDICTYSSDR